MRKSRKIFTWIERSRLVLHKEHKYCNIFNTTFVPAYMNVHGFCVGKVHYYLHKFFIKIIITTSKRNDVKETGGKIAIFHSISFECCPPHTVLWQCSCHIFWLKSSLLMIRILFSFFSLYTSSIYYDDKIVLCSRLFFLHMIYYLIYMSMCFPFNISIKVNKHYAYIVLLFDMFLKTLLKIRIIRYYYIVQHQIPIYVYLNLI